MGIKDLLRFMKPYTEPIHIHKYSGKRVGIDAYSWLHKGAYSCSMELCLNSEGEKKYQYINYFMHRINLLKHHKITPVVVFDGGNIPCKATTENDRCRRRKVNREMAMEKLKDGNVNAASDLFQKAISITPSVAHQLIQVLKSENVEFMVAPYEADAQLAYLSSIGEQESGIHAVISEDSDLLAYGCPSVIFKMDKFGNGEEIALDKVFNSSNTKPSFRDFDQVLFIEMCVLAGCDFLPSIPGIGIARAHAFVSKYRNIDRILSVLKFEKSKQIPQDYDRSFREAVAVFQHAKIYNRNKKRLDHIKELPQQLLEALGGEVDFLGPDIPPSLAIAIAEGNLDPTTMEAYECSPSYKRRRSVFNPKSLSQKSGEENMLGLGTVEGTIQINAKNYKSKSVPAVEVYGGKENPSKSCFMVYSSQNTKATNESTTSTMAVERRVLKERNVSDEVAYLAALAFPSEVLTCEFSGVSEDHPLNTPNNNPFRKRKCVSEDSETMATPMSAVTECEQLELKSLTFDSQESVNSKIKKFDDKTKKGTSVKKPKTNKCKSSDNKNGSILNFFTRILG